MRCNLPRCCQAQVQCDKVWLVSFMQYDLGFFDQETGWITSVQNPFGAKVLPMCPV